MKKLEISAKTLDDKIMKDGACAVATLSDKPDSKGCYFIVGGIATQSYLPTKCRRETSDIDLAVLKPLSYEDFKSFSKIVREYLQDNHYQTDIRKASRAFCIDFKDKEDNQAFIEFARNTEKSFAKKEERFQREKKNARSKIIEGTATTYIVSSPEDIMVPKLVRSINSLKRNPNFIKHINNMKDLSDEEIAKNLGRIKELRLEAMTNSGDVKNYESLRFVSDLYDVRLLSELSGVNPDYFKESASYWNSLTEKSFERDFIAKVTLPDELIYKSKKQCATTH